LTDEHGEPVEVGLVVERAGLAARGLDRHSDSVPDTPIDARATHNVGTARTQGVSAGSGRGRQRLPVT
jgi:hypothetical protein